MNAEVAFYLAMHKKYFKSSLSLLVNDLLMWGK